MDKSKEELYRDNCHLWEEKCNYIHTKYVNLKRRYDELQAKTKPKKSENPKPKKPKSEKPKDKTRDDKPKVVRKCTKCKLPIKGNDHSGCKKEK